jgi:DNA-binding transcriptional MerR regulator
MYIPVATLSQRDVLQIAGIQPKAFQSWIYRGILKPPGPVSPGKGNHRRYSHRDAMILKTAADLHRIGFPIERSLEIALLAVEVLPRPMADGYSLGAGVSLDKTKTEAKRQPVAVRGELKSVLEEHMRHWTAGIIVFLQRSLIDPAIDTGPDRNQTSQKYCRQTGRKAGVKNYDDAVIIAMERL